MATLATSRNIDRPATVTAAVALLALTAALFPPAALALGGFDPGFLAIGGTLAALKLVAAAGLWRGRRWAAVLGLVAALLDTLLALPGLLDASNGALRVLVTVGVVIGITTLVLLGVIVTRRARA